MGPIFLRNVLRVKGCRLAILLAPVLSGVLGAADLQLWNTTEFTVIERRGFRWEGFGIVRTRNHASDAYDDRLGTGVSYHFSPRLIVGGRYQRRWVDPDGKGSHQENRVSFSPTVVVLPAPLRIESTTTFDRSFRIPGRADFNSYRETVDIERRRQGPSPFLYEQMTWRREGFVRSRTAAGVRWHFPGGRDLEIGYQLETYQDGSAWRPRHSIRTAIDLGNLFSHRRRE